jgi:predicted  nucleic acid-binding Zn-ribbon protein
MQFQIKDSMAISKSTLISRKEMVRVKITQTQREIEKTRLMGSRASKQLAQLERKLEQLQGEETKLRQDIDKASEAEQTADKE